jgi:N-acetyl-anhydromuramyl-L-alanine amidase AmpD
MLRLDQSLMSQFANDQRIRMIILHYTAVSFTETINIFRQGQVSAHYLIPDPDASDYLECCAVNHSDSSENNKILQLVADDGRAWHAGESFWRGRTHLNDCSIGIEIVYIPGTAIKNDPPYTETQIQEVEALCRHLLQKYPIAPHNIVGHSDVSYDRKSDPGPQFPWQQLHEKGIGAWPERTKVKAKTALHSSLSSEQLKHLLIQHLVAYGYRAPVTADDEARLIWAFKSHFDPASLDQPLNAQTLAIAETLCEQYLS